MQRPIKRTSRAARSFRFPFHLRFVPFFLVIRISINLVAIPAGFFLRLCHHGQYLRTTCRPVLGGTVSFFFSLDKFTRVEKNCTPMFVLFSYVFYYALEDTRYIVSREGCVADQNVACRAFITPRHIAPFFPSLCNLIKTRGYSPGVCFVFKFLRTSASEFFILLRFVRCENASFLYHSSSKDKRFLP